LKNRSPIILNCFSRGGSNLLWNILLSHPGVCSPMQETLEIFRLDWRDPRREGLSAAWLTRQWRFFDQWHLETRLPISSRAQAFVDQTLFNWKLKTLEDPEMRYKAEDEIYSLEEVSSARLVLKNNNGTIFLSEQFVEMYPDAVFFGLVRDPVPLYESHRRNRTPVSRSPGAFADFYRRMVQKMRCDAERWSFYHLLRFEDVVCEPVKAMRDIYACTSLDRTAVPKVRFKAKPHMQADGSHATHLQAGRHYWFSYDEIPQIIEPSVNRYQLSKLAPAELDRIRSLTRGVREELGYHEG
jgi:hypothetical protein